MGLDRFFGQAELGGDLLIGLTLANTRQHFELTQGKQADIRDGLWRIRRRSARGAVRQPRASLEVGRHADIAFENLLQDLEQHARGR